MSVDISIIDLLKMAKILQYNVTSLECHSHLANFCLIEIFGGKTPDQPSSYHESSNVGWIDFVSRIAAEGNHHISASPFQTTGKPWPFTVWFLKLAIMKFYRSDWIQGLKMSLISHPSPRLLHRSSTPWEDIQHFEKCCSR